MLFHMELMDSGAINGWILPDNPSLQPRIKILIPGQPPIELDANVLRTDLRDRGQHETGMAGFYIDEKIVPDLAQAVDRLEIRDSDTNILVFRKYQESKHIGTKLFRFELRAMPDLKLESLFSKHFTFYHHTAQRYPQDTFFGIINNQAAKSIYLSGRPNFQQYEHWFRERSYKIVALIRNPFEELAERLLFARYASGPNVPAFVDNYICGLEPLVELVKDVRFESYESVSAAIASITDAQKRALANPLVKAIACLPDEYPKSGHVEIALSKLSRMDLVGLYNRFDDFKSILQEVLGVDVLRTYERDNLSLVQRLVGYLMQLRQARALISLDLELYSHVEQAITEAIGPCAAGA